MFQNISAKELEQSRGIYQFGDGTDREIKLTNVNNCTLWKVTDHGKLVCETTDLVFAIYEFNAIGRALE
jgi:hypothetical protein